VLALEPQHHTPHTFTLILILTPSFRHKSNPEVPPLLAKTSPSGPCYLPASHALLFQGKSSATWPTRRRRRAALRCYTCLPSPHCPRKDSLMQDVIISTRDTGPACVCATRSILRYRHTLDGCAARPLVSFKYSFPRKPPPLDCLASYSVAPGRCFSFSLVCFDPHLQAAGDSIQHRHFNP